VRVVYRVSATKLQNINKNIPAVSSASYPIAS
jgi:hypothetical protein